MDIHKNARLTLHSREALAQFVLRGHALAAAAAFSGHPQDRRQVGPPFSQQGDPRDSATAPRARNAVRARLPLGQRNGWLNCAANISRISDRAQHRHSARLGQPYLCGVLVSADGAICIRLRPWCATNTLPRRSAAPRYQGPYPLSAGFASCRRTPSRHAQAPRLRGLAHRHRRSFPLWPLPSCLPDQKTETTIGFLRDALAFYRATASGSAACSPTTEAPIAPTSFATPVPQLGDPAPPHPPLHPREPTAKPNASSRPPCANGPTPNTGKTPMNATALCSPGPTTTTSPAPMVASTTTRPSAAPNRVQRLDHLQPPARQVCFFT